MGQRNAFIFRIIGVLVFMSMVHAQDPHGIPGVDYPNYFTIPETSFKCSDQKYNPGFYADVETKCQAFHFCYQDRQESFLCPTGTIFNQAVLTCDVWYKSNCSLAQKFYSINAGPVMERAGKNLPMLLRLRNRSQSKPTVTPSANVFNKVSSLYENKPPSEIATVAKADNELDTKSSDLSVESSLKDSGNKNEEMLSDSNESFEPENIETDNEFINEVDEEMDTNLVYDNVNDGYYKNYDQFDEYKDNEPENQEFNDFYDYRNPNNGYEREELKDYVNEESLEDSDLTIVDDSEHSDFGKRSSQAVHSRRRRKPLYVVLNDEPEIKAEKMAEKSELESLNSGVREAKEMNLTSDSAEQAANPEPFPRPTAIPHHLLDISTETPMTSEEFERAIIEELVIPGMTTEDNEEEVTEASYPLNDQGSFEQTNNQSPDAESDDDIYIENDLEPESYAPYDSQYEDVIVVPEYGEEAYVESYSESPDIVDAESDTEDTFVVIPDEYDDNAVDPVSSENDFEISDYSQETAYGTQVLSDQSPEAGYDDSYRYIPSAEYSQYYEQANYYPEQAAEMYDNYVQQDQRYDYDSYDVQNHPMNYESSEFGSEEAHTQTEMYPYEETRIDVTEKQIPLPVTEADLDTLSNEEFDEIPDAEQHIIEEPEKEPEDVFYVFDFDEEQPNKINETEISGGDEMEPKESLEEKLKQAEQSFEVKPLNKSTEESSEKENSINTQTREESPDSDEEDWPSNSKNEDTEPPKAESEINKVNKVASPNSNYASQPTPPVHESLSSFNTPFSSSMGSFDFSTDSRFLNNIGYSESMDFGPYGFGPNMGQQFSMMESMQQGANPFSQRISPVEQPKLSPLSAIQEKMRSMKQGKFGAFKKYMSSTSK